MVWGQKKIANTLSERKIVVPSEHFRRLGHPVPAKVPKDIYAWQETTITHILTRMDYVGHIQHGENVFIKAHNGTNPKGNCVEKPCVTGVLTKRKSTIVSDTFVSKLSCLFGGSGGIRTHGPISGSLDFESRPL